MRAQWRRAVQRTNGVWRFRDEAHPRVRRVGASRVMVVVCDGSGRSVGAGGRGWNWGSTGTMEGKEASEGSRESGEKMGAYANGGTGCWGAHRQGTYTMARTATMWVIRVAVQVDDALIPMAAVPISNMRRTTHGAVAVPPTTPPLAPPSPSRPRIP